MMALALVPEEFVRQLFSNLAQELTESDCEDLSGLFNYFDRQWMGNLGAWNVFNVSDKTNNYSEGIESLRIVLERHKKTNFQAITTGSRNDCKRIIPTSGYSSILYAKKWIRFTIWLVKFIPVCSRMQSEKWPTSSKDVWRNYTKDSTIKQSQQKNYYVVFHILLHIRNKKTLSVQINSTRKFNLMSFIFLQQRTF